MSYCVVGGGISGLVAALRLRRAVGPDATITVFDPADRLGGILRTERVGGQTMDIGAEAFVVRRPEVPALLADLGLAGRRISPTGTRPLIYADARLHPLPAGTVNGIPSAAETMTDLVDAATVAHMGAEPTRPLSWTAGADPSAGDFVGDRFGAQVVARSVDPMLSGVYAGAAGGIGLRSAVPAVAAALDRGAPNLTEAVRAVLPPGPAGPVFGAVEGGYQVVLDALIAQSGLRWQPTAVVELQRDGGGWNVYDDEGACWPADGVILALPAPRLATLTAGVAPRTAAAARRIEVASSVVVALAAPGGTPLPQNSGVLVATGERLHAKAITLSSRKWGPRGNVELMRLSFGRCGDTIARDTSDDVLLDWSLEDLRTVFGIDVAPVDVRMHRWLDAMPQYAPGHGGLVAELRAGLPPGLAVAGNFLDGIGVPACAAAAGLAVESLLGRVGR